MLRYIAYWTVYHLWRCDGKRSSYTAEVARPVVKHGRVEA